jgi:carbon monoxide dehydrogenase subunit G
MPTTRRSRTVADVPERVWETVSDPYHLPRWWPRVERVEGVHGDQFTEVLTTDRGRSVRADFKVVESLAPERRAWEQEVAGSPFERIMVTARTEVQLAPEGGGTRVTLAIRQQMRGTARFAGWMVRRATRRVLDDALRALEGLHGA